MIFRVYGVLKTVLQMSFLEQVCLATWMQKIVILFGSPSISILTETFNLSLLPFSDTQEPTSPPCPL